MKLVSYNIQYGFGADGRYDLERVARVVADADIIALQEVERFWQRTGDDDQPEILGRLLPDHYWVYGPAFDMDASSATPAAASSTAAGSSAPCSCRGCRSPGRGCTCCRCADGAAAQHAERGARMPDPHAGRAGAVLLAASRPYRRRGAAGADRFPAGRSIAALPFEGGPWSGDDDEPARNWTNGEAEPESPLAAIWMGDFNSEPGSAEYRRIAGDNPYHPGAAYLDGFRRCRGRSPVRSPAGLHTHVKKIGGRPKRRRLDYCFVGSLLAARALGRIASTMTRSPRTTSRSVVDIDLENPDARRR